MDVDARRDRLVALLRRSGHTRVDALADELRVSRRTVLRDLGRLRDRGFRIASEGGPGGGVSLDPRSVLVSAQLAADEIVALSLSVALLRASAFMPFAAQAERGLAKIEGSLSRERVVALRQVTRRVLVGAPAETGLPIAAIDAALLPAFERAFTARQLLAFDYVGRDERATTRRVEPHALLVRAPLWYVVAWDRDKDAARLFRMDRIARPRVLEAAFDARPMELGLGVCPDARPSVRRAPRGHRDTRSPRRDAR